MLAGGERIGPYEISSLLGSGGMGEVYRARDTRLGREVAIKLLPARYAEDGARLRRFEQEARAATALNHPNIITVHDVGSFGASLYIAMELVDGKTLRRILSSGALPTKKAANIAIQLADGLAKAHEAHIVHRDLKPENVMVSKDGFVKILDFGLAKLTAPEVEPSAETVSTQDGTSPGTVVGTIGYMSPEQARGDTVTPASDQFSFGSIVYEALTGRRAFQGRSSADLLSAILRDDPTPIARLNPGVPASLVRILERCLAKAAEDRYDSTRDLLKDLRAVEERDLRDSAVERAQPSATRPVRRVVPRWLAFAALAASAVAISLLARPRPATTSPEIRRLTYRSGVVSRALYAPHSNSILYTAAWGNAPSRTFITLPGSPSADRSLDAEVQMPMAFRGDGSQALVLVGTSFPRIAMYGTLAWWPVMGGKARPILDDVGWADWSERAKLLAVVRSAEGRRKLELFDADGRPLRTLFETAGAISFVRFSPRDDEVAFVHHPTLEGNSGEVRLAKVDGTASRSLTPRYARCFGLDWNAPRDEIWYTASAEGRGDTSLLAVSAKRTPRVVSVLPDDFVLEDVSESGDRILLVSDEQKTNLLVRDGGGNPVDFSWLRWTLVADLSPDERSLLFFDQGATEAATGAWVRPLAGGDALSLGNLAPAQFSPDGRWIVGTQESPDGGSQVVLVPVGSGSPRQLTHGPETSASPSFAGRTSVLFVRYGERGSELRRVGIDGSGERPLGVTGCDFPAAHPLLDRLLCLSGPRNGAIMTWPLAEPGSHPAPEGRKLFELPGTERFRYARWSAGGDLVYAVTGDRELLSIDAKSGAVLRREILPLSGGGAYPTLYSAVVSGDARLQAYSIASFASDLYQMAGVQ